MRKLLYFLVVVALSFIGMLAMLLTEGCSTACDWLDERIKSPPKPQLTEDKLGQLVRLQAQWFNKR